MTRKNVIFQTRRMLITQIILSSVIVLFFLCLGVELGISAALGVCASIIPTIFFAKRFFSSAHLTDPHQIIRRFYVSELIKLMSSAIIIALVLTWLHVNILAFFSGFLGAYLSLWLAPLLATNNKKVTR